MNCTYITNDTRQLQALQANLDTFFLIIMGILLFFMQAGFAFLEAGSVRSKNTINILLKNFLNVLVGAVVFWACGFAFAFGEPKSNAFFGYRNFFFENFQPSCYALWFCHFFFAATAATIVSGALAERTEFMAYMISSCLIIGFVYPFVAHWQWTQRGWLYIGLAPGIRFKDFAGCGAVHIVGGTASLVGAKIVGPRLGRFVEKGKARPIEGHTLPQVALGGFILFFGFFAFNAVAHLSISKPGDGDIVARTAVNTLLSGSMGAIVAMTIRRKFYRKKHWSLVVAINGGLTGMVANGAGSHVVDPWGGALTGAVAGVVYIFLSSLIVKFKIDDPLHASAVHLGGGLLGILSVPFLDASLDERDNHIPGIFYSTRSTLGQAFQILAWNIFGALVIFVWTGVIIGSLFLALKRCGKLRVSPDVEEKGLDLAKHGEAAYPLSAYGHGWEDEQDEDDDEDEEEESNDNGVFGDGHAMVEIGDRQGDAGVYVGGEDNDDEKPETKADIVS